MLMTASRMSDVRIELTTYCSAKKEGTKQELEDGAQF
jgi:hypothetical protein